MHLVSTRCNCDKNVLESIYKELISGSSDDKKATCTYKYSRGTNKGERCGEDVTENKLCKKHAKQQATKEKIQGKIVKSQKKEASETVIVEESQDKTSETVVVKESQNKSETVVVEESQKKTSETVVSPPKDKSETVVSPQKDKSETVVSPQKDKSEIVKDEPVVHFDSKLEKIMMHVNKSPSEITKTYEKIIPTQVAAVAVKKRRILPPSLRPELKIGDKVLYNDGKKTCKATIKKFVKDMAHLENVYESKDTSSFTGPTRYMIKLN